MRFLRKRQRLWSLIVVVASLALIVTSFLPLLIVLR